MDDKNNKITQPMNLNMVIITCANDSNLKQCWQMMVNVNRPWGYQQMMTCIKGESRI